MNNPNPNPTSTPTATSTSSVASTTSSNWATVASGAPSYHQRSRRSHQQAIDPPDVSGINTPEEEFYHQYAYKLTELEEKFNEYTDHIGLQHHLLSKMTNYDLLQFAQRTSSEYDYFQQKYKKQVQKAYKNANVKYRTVYSSDSEDGE